MFTIPFGFVTEWMKFANIWAPRSIDIECPHCARLVNFGFGAWPHNTELNYATAASKCSGCGQQVLFWAIRPRVYGNASGQECEELCIHPTPKLRRLPMAAVDTIPESISRAYVSAINVYNTREWTAAAVLCRRVLEGLTKSQLPEELRKRSLAQQLQELPNHVDHAKPITTLADAIRRGGNLGAHFDEDKEADQETVTMMLDLLEYLMEYVYALPSRIDQLHQKVAANNQANP